MDTNNNADAPSLTKEQLVEMLNSGKEGITKFNELRKQFPSWEPNFSSASFIFLDLSEVDLKDVYLINAYFLKVNLRGVDLSRAVLSGARFADTDLRGANLTNVDLSDVDLTFTHLSGVNFRGAILIGAEINASVAELVTTKGLETARGVERGLLADMIALGYKPQS